MIRKIKNRRHESLRYYMNGLLLSHPAAGNPPKQENLHSVYSGKTELASSSDLTTVFQTDQQALSQQNIRKGAELSADSRRQHRHQQRFPQGTTVSEQFPLTSLATNHRRSFYIELPKTKTNIYVRQIQQASNQQSIISAVNPPITSPFLRVY